MTTTPMPIHFQSSLPDIDSLPRDPMRFCSAHHCTDRGVGATLQVPRASRPWRAARAPIAAPVKQTLQVPGVGNLRAARGWSWTRWRGAAHPIDYEALWRRRESFRRFGGGPQAAGRGRAGAAPREELEELTEDALGHVDDEDHQQQAVDRAVEAVDVVADGDAQDSRRAAA